MCCLLIFLGSFVYYTDFEIVLLSERATLLVYVLNLIIQIEGMAWQNGPYKTNTKNDTKHIQHHDATDI